ncbi:MAG: AbrB/MazE/SpoVT family DNA-binding domain-containing protein [Cyclobacteriaceae bacterium]|nr:AbrB/MazE/SpoVT family DNA-binding domain-containing protein [Cyclobacteriaceae bacterium]
MEASITTAKGQVIIPKSLRKKFGIKAGTKVIFSEKDGEITMRALTRQYFKNLAGWLKEGDDLLKDLLKEKKLEVRKDEKRSL